ncbi:diguanylate cyclase with PAS/PAC sensor [Paraglaciecola sp. T6c]|uniref:GGDEF domain-containing protein n=1 Tax=Pseudoalteromonas atlantica (strain T6c / ATCC BAA-1087) TaxID=3042615 RepID=UPI00005C70B5|nr:diguanylate cyclase [Paraglaciecola sp. T6c]ABG38928.1 diguanylate cyclase with PAS/PAC sensor [Paraglaciecola sp. T6c]
MPDANQPKNKNVNSSSLLEALSLPLLNEKMHAFSKMVNVIAEAIFIVNGDGVIEVINPLAAKFFGAPQEALIGQKWFQFLHERYREQYEYLFINWNKTSGLPLNHGPKEVLINRHDNTWLEADLSVSCLPTSLTASTPLFVGVMHNLTKHKSEYSELRRLASTDHLTGLANRHNLEKTLQKSWLDCVNTEQAISLILIDVDYFKLFNDQFGHVNGDKCLQKIARTIEQCLPSNDSLAARYGGEEFAVILPRLRSVSAEIVAKDIQQQINTLNFSDLGLPSSFRVSVSQGIATELGGQFRTSEALICASDTALYRAKSDGRNRISISP